MFLFLLFFFFFLGNAEYLQLHLMAAAFVRLATALRMK